MGCDAPRNAVVAGSRNLWRRGQAVTNPDVTLGLRGADISKPNRQATRNRHLAPHLGIFRYTPASAGRRGPTNESLLE